jgi:YHS domain-containing protein
MLRFVAIPLFVVAMLVAGCGKTPTSATEDTRTAQTSKTEKDPVCGMKVDPKTAPSSTYQGKTYYFCSPEEKTEFDKNPAKYVANS